MQTFSGTRWPCLARLCGVTVMEARGRGVGMTIVDGGCGIVNEITHDSRAGPALQILQSRSSFKVQPRYAGGCGVNEWQAHSERIPKALTQFGSGSGDDVCGTGMS
jgi:hypothetical protein